jgi:phosphohistidine phosphatase
MRLLLLRHGIAADLHELPARADGSRPVDADRPLTERGRRRLQRTARGLRRLAVRPERILHSGLVRARETAEIVAAGLRLREPRFVEVAALRPEADPRELLRLLPSLEAEQVLCVGHAPNLDRIAALACGIEDRLVSALGKAGAACVAFSSASASEGWLEWLATPRLLRRLGR